MDTDNLFIDLSKIVKSDGAVLDIDRIFPAKAFDELDSCINFASDVLLVVSITNISNNTLFINANISFSVNLLCDRCLAPMTKQFNIRLEDNLAKENSLLEEGDYIVYHNDKVLLLDAIYQAIFVEISEKQLCSIHCKGLCTVCGADLNVAPCNCQTEEIDPRLLKLKDFFK
jgi:uncharacterized protein